MKVLGHPLHTLLIHFPVALLPAHYVFALLFYFTGNSTFGPTAFYMLLGGVGFGWLAACMGLLDYYVIPEQNHVAKNKAFLHGCLSVVVLLGFSFITYWQWKVVGIVAPESIKILIASGLLILVLLVGGYFGGDLVYVEHIGIDKNKRT